jgi:hypothetical protein
MYSAHNLFANVILILLMSFSNYLKLTKFKVYIKYVYSVILFFILVLLLLLLLFKRQISTLYQVGKLLLAFNAI